MWCASSAGVSTSLSSTKSTPSDSSTCASTKWPMRALAITGIFTAAMIPSIISGSLMRATPPSRRMSAGTRSSAMTAVAPASSAMRACSGVTTSMMTPPFSISARPRFTRAVPVAWGACGAASRGLMSRIRRSSYRRSAAGSATQPRKGQGYLTVVGSMPAGMCAALVLRTTSTQVRPGVSSIVAPEGSLRVKGTIGSRRSQLPWTRTPAV